MIGTGADGLSVVVPARDEAATIGRQLDSVVAGNPDIEVVVADNGSTDGTQDVVREFARRHPRTILLDASATPGPSFARNQGIAAASHEMVALCDADDVVAPGWADAVHAGLRHHEFVGGPLEFELLNPSWLCDARGRERTRQFWTLEDVGGPAWPHVTTCNLGIRRSAHTAIGGFDESLQWSEDNDYAFRLRLQLGLTPEWVEDALVHYRYRTSFRDLRAQANHDSQGLAVLVNRYGEFWQHPPARAAQPSGHYEPEYASPWCATEPTSHAGTGTSARRRDTPWLPAPRHGDWSLRPPAPPRSATRPGTPTPSPFTVEQEEESVRVHVPA